MSYPVDELIIYADEAILVVNKPVGLLSLQDGYDKTIPHLSVVLSPVYGQVWMVHRLDRETSGVMVVARSALAHHHLNEQFKNRQVTKIYHALVYGNPDWDQKELEIRLLKDGDRQHRTIMHPRGKPSSSSFSVLKRYPNYALIQAEPHTGYTHQIRAHLAYLGFPVVGDGLYGKKALEDDLARRGSPLLNRVALHALSLSFIHPLLLTQVNYTSPYPADFLQVINQLDE